MKELHGPRRQHADQLGAAGEEHAQQPGSKLVPTRELGQGFDLRLIQRLAVEVLAGALAEVEQRVRLPEVVWGLYGVLALLGLVYFRRRPARFALLFVLFVI